MVNSDLVSAKIPRSGSSGGADLSAGVKQYKDCIRCEVGVKRMDALGRDYTADSITETVEAHLSYLKLINVPTMFDIGCYQANP